MRPVVVAQTATAGGAESYLVRLYDALRARGHDPHLVGAVPGWEERGLSRTPASLGPKWGAANVATGALRLPRERALVKRLASDLGADVFHVQFKREQIGLTSILSPMAPVVWTEHGRFLSGPRGQLLAAGYARASRRASAIICVSDQIADDVRRIVGPRVRLEVISNAIDTQMYRPPSETERAAARAELGLELDAPVLLFVGRLDAGKLPRLAAAAGALFSGTTLLVGDGTERGAIEKTDFGGRVRLIGHLPEPLVAYRAADAFLFTSSGASEGFPTTILEAAAHGLPIVANRSCGADALVVAAGGRVVDATATALSAAVVEILRDTGERGARAREWAMRHDVVAWTTAHEELMGTV